MRITSADCLPKGRLPIATLDGVLLDNAKLFMADSDAGCVDVLDEEWPTGTERFTKRLHGVVTIRWRYFGPNDG